LLPDKIRHPSAEVPHSRIRLALFELSFAYPCPCIEQLLADRLVVAGR